MKTYSLFALLLAFTLSGCWRSHRETEVSGVAQGTNYHIKLVLDGESAALDDIRRQVAATLAELDAQLSSYREDSEISRLNRKESVDWLPVSPEIAELLVVADTVYQRSDGCYDLTVKPLLDLWGFSGRDTRVPSDKEIAKLLPHVGMQLLEIDRFNHRIKKKDPKLKIDLSSLVQGYSVGVLAHRLDSMGVKNYQVEIGGEMMVKGRKANGEDWRVGVEAPTPFARTIHKVLDIKELGGAAVMTAGTYRNYFEEKGQTYSHILNPKTGRPVTHHLRSVTVVDSDPTWAGAWDNALLCVGEESAVRLAEEENLKVLLLYDKDQKLKEYMSKALATWQ